MKKKGEDDVNKKGAKPHTCVAFNEATITVIAAIAVIAASAVIAVFSKLDIDGCGCSHKFGTADHQQSRQSFKSPISKTRAPPKNQTDKKNRRLRHRRRL